MVELAQAGASDGLRQVLELKFNQDADTAISQIKRRQYPAKVAQYSDNLLLVGISYDKQQKTHQCVIERYGV